MTDQPLQDDQPKTPDTGADVPEWAHDPNRAYEAIRELREENKTRREQFTQFETMLKSIVERLPADDDADSGDDDNPIAALEARLERVDQLFQEEVKRREQAERSAIITALATKYNLPDQLAARLQGNTPDELEEDAKALAQILPASAQSDGSPVNGRGIFRTTTPVPGGQPSSGQRENELRRRLFGRSTDSDSGSSEAGNGRVRNW